MNIHNKISIIYKKKYSQIFFQKILARYAISKIFYFSGQSSVSKSEKLNFVTLNSNVNPLVDLLEAIRNSKLLKVKLLNAVSSEMFGSRKKKINENTTLNPASFYGLAKCINFEICRSYRLQFKLNIVNLILFNHESYLRPKNFILKKIISGIRDIKFAKNKMKKIEIGNINIKRDWGWAPEYVRFMYKISILNFIGDIVVATGKSQKLSYVIKKILKKNNLSFKKVIKISKKYYRKNEIKENYADISKIKRIFNSKPKYGIAKIIDNL